jgi:hypothetical protein
VLSLIARGLTNRQIAHELEITERGVAAHVSRLLAKFDAPNRAGLIARFVTDQVNDETMDPAGQAGDSEFVAGLVRELEVFESAPLIVGCTVGPGHVISYQNRLGRAVTGGTVVGRRHEDAFRGDASQALWREKTNEAFVGGRPVTLSGARSRWQRDDGSWADEVFNCVAQPLTDRLGITVGVLWICALAASEYG